MDFAAVAELCAPDVSVNRLRSIASVESSFNPLAIGVVGGRLQRQPNSLAEALATAQMLDAQGFDYSLGLMQVNQRNFLKYGLTAESAFDPCSNMRVGSLIYQDCLKRAGGADPSGDALSCYTSGNFKTGYSIGYVAKVQAAYAPEIPPWPLAAVAIPLAAKRSAGPRKRPSVKAAAPEALFVTAFAPPGQTVATSGDISPTSKGRDTALLF